MTKQATSTKSDNEPKLDADGNPIGPDIMPEPIDDDPAPASSAGSAPRNDDPADPAPRRERKSKPQHRDKRDEITEMFRKMRDQQREQAGDDADVLPAAALIQKQETVDQPESLEAIQQKNAPATDDLPPSDGGQSDVSNNIQEPEIELKIDGQTIRKPLSEVKRLAQMAAAGEIRLDKAKELVNEVKTLRDQLLQQLNQAAPQQTATSQPQQATPASASPAPAAPQASVQTAPGQTQTTDTTPAGVDVDREKLRQIAERLQVGDTDEGAQALAEYTAELLARAQQRQPAIQPEQVAQWVSDAVFQIQTKAEADAALQRFAQKYEPLVKNDVLAVTTLTVLTRELMNDLRQAGYRDEDLQAIRHDRMMLANLHRQARQTNGNLRSYDKLLTDVGEYMVKTFNLNIGQQQNSHGTQSPAANPQQGAPTSTVQDRQQRLLKLPQQPRPVNVRVSPETGPRPRTKEEYLNDLRKARGFSPR